MHLFYFREGRLFHRILTLEDYSRGNFKKSGDREENRIPLDADQSGGIV